MTAYAAFPQSPSSHGRDYSVRLRQHVLEAIVFEHDHTTQDPMVMEDAHEQLGVLPVLAGSTEWSGTAPNGRPTGLSWDWALTQDLQVRLIMRVSPRSNVRLIDSKGYDLPHSQNAQQMFEVVRGIDWQNAVLDALQVSQSLPAGPLHS